MAEAQVEEYRGPDGPHLRFVGACDPTLLPVEQITWRDRRRPVRTRRCSSLLLCLGGPMIGLEWAVVWTGQVPPWRTVSFDGSRTSRKRAWSGFPRDR
jgi:hypothetical protein